MLLCLCREAAAMLLASLAVYHCGQHLCAAPKQMHLNYRPIIGIMAQEIRKSDKSAKGSFYIAASYVKYLEGAGARVAPIRVGLKEEEYIKLFNSINGLLLPGGSISIEKSEASHIANFFYTLALKANDAQDYFPIWGTCLGFQQLSCFTANKFVLIETNTTGVALPLQLTKEAPYSRLFRSLPSDVLQSLANENITSNYHMFSVSKQVYNENPKLKSFYKVLSTNTDGKTEFISTMEAYRYPFYGVQWHPEKCIYEWIDKPGMVHSRSATRAAFYTASFFVSEAMKSNHRFSSFKEEEEALIYNYIPSFNSLKSVNVQNYYFD